MGNILNVGFEKILLLQNATNASASEVISTYVYKSGIQGAQYSFSAAIGLFNNVVTFILLILVNAFARRVGNTSLW
jgi:putative aldouronate transport system permease protein